MMPAASLPDPFTLPHANDADMGRKSPTESNPDPATPNHRETLEDLAANADELRALVRETLREELRPLAALAEAMTRWAQVAEAGVQRLKERHP